MKIHADIEGRMASVSFVKQDGRHVAKNISVDVLCNILQKRDSNSAELVIVPPGLRLHAHLGGKLFVGYEMYEGKQNVTFSVTRNGRTENEVYSIILPHNMTFMEFYTTEDTGELAFKRLYQYALKAPFYGMNTPLFQWPFPNTYQDGACCMGSTRIPNYKDLKATAGAIALFHQGIYNHDLSSQRFTAFTPPDSVSSITTSQQLFAYLHSETDPKPFPYNVLKPQFTVKDLFERVGYGTVI